MSVCVESFSLVTQEAFLFGTPVVASDIGGMAELVCHGFNGLLFKAGDVLDLRAKIHRLVKDPGEVRRLAVNGPRVKSSTEYATEIERLYERVLAGRHGT